MPDHRRLLYWICTRLYLERVTVLGTERLPARGPALYISTHRCGMLDGFVLDTLLHRPTYMIAAQWTRGVRGLFFAGISVVRDKDAGDRSGNARALERCVEHLARGGELAVFPEGTSSLGPRHLPFKTGAARVLAAYLARSAEPIAVVPLGLHYEGAPDWRSRLELVVGPPLELGLDPQLDGEQRVAELQQRIARSLEAVGVQFADEREQELAEALAYATTLGTARSYSGALKELERGIPAGLARSWSELVAQLEGRRVWLHQGVPLVPTAPLALYLLALLPTAALSLSALLLNAPVIAAAAWAGARIPDERNVIPLWRLLVGVPLLLVWAPAACVAAWLLLGPWSALGYVLLSWAGLRCIYRARKLAIACHNALFAGDLRPRILELHGRLLEELTH